MIRDARYRLLVAAAAILLGTASAGLAASAGNDYYDIAVQSSTASVGLGVYTCTTGLMHPITGSLGWQNVLVGNGFPGTSFTTIRSYTSGTDYVQRNGLTLSSGAPPTLELEGFVAPGEEAEPVGDPAAPTGLVTIYRPGDFAPAPDNLVIRQTIEAVGTTFDDSAVMLKTEITNNGSASVSVGVRYLMDMTIGSQDDGPSFKTKGPDGSALSTETDFLDPAFAGFEMTDDNNSAACFGIGNQPFPFYSVQGSVNGPASMAPTPPTRVAFVGWPRISGLPGKLGGISPAGNAFDYLVGTADISTCLVTADDTAVAYWWGDTSANALAIAPGQTASVSAYLFAYLPGTPPVFPAAGVEGPPGDPTCSDALDNDGDGLVDLGDPDCVATSEGPPGSPTCSDGLDNDQDGLIDLADPDCVPPVEGPPGDQTCSDQIDNDLDGLTDMADPDCVPAVEGPAGDPTCSDQIDNDGDGLTDMADPDCAPPVEGPPGDPTCFDQIDNDLDGYTDMADADCISPVEGPPGDPTCSDQIDNDGDGLVDLADPDCTAQTNSAPLCAHAEPSVDRLWPANHKLHRVMVTGVTDADGDPVSVRITAIMQDEPVESRGDGTSCSDGFGVGTDTARLRAERSGISDGRVYHVSFVADDGAGGQCTGEVTVCVPRSRGRAHGCIDQGPLFESRGNCGTLKIKRHARR